VLVDGAPGGEPIPNGMQIPWSETMRKTQRCVARLHARIANILANTLHLVERFDVIAIEDLNVGGMLKNHTLARAIADMGWAECRRQLEYKATQRGKTVIVVPRGYPSSKRCSACGTVQDEMPLAVRQWTCLDCGTHHDRDENAARNLLAYGLAAAALRRVPPDVKPVERKALASSASRW
jgi:putative transposase